MSTHHSALDAVLRQLAEYFKDERRAHDERTAFLRACQRAGVKPTLLTYIQMLDYL